MPEMKKVSKMNLDEIKEEVRKTYSRVAGENIVCGYKSKIRTSSSCCSDSTRHTLTPNIGYLV